MTASLFKRRRAEILAAALLLAGALLITAVLSGAQRLSAAWGACHRLLPRLPEAPRPAPWRIRTCPDHRSPG